MDSVSDSNNNRSVWVTNISPKATEDNVCTFFAFCGKIESMTFSRHEGEEEEEGGEGRAHVRFQSEAATKTALLLSGAVILDRPIKVFSHQQYQQYQHQKQQQQYQHQHQQQQYPHHQQKEYQEYQEFQGYQEYRPYATASNVQGQYTETHYEGASTPVWFQFDSIKNQPYLPPAEERSKTSVIASLIASGYVIAADIVARAREFDEQNQVSQKVMEAAEAFVEKVKSIDQQYKISEKIETLASDVREKAKEVDQKYGIVDTTNQVTAQVSTAITDQYNKAWENPTVLNAYNKLNEWGQNVGQTFQQITEESKMYIDQRMSQGSAETH